MRRKPSITLLAALLGILLAAPAFAWMCGRAGGWVGPTSLPPGQTAALQKIEAKYGPQLQAMEQQLDSNANALATARTEGNAAKIDALRQEQARLEKNYWSLLDRANGEAYGVVGSGYGPWFYGGYRGYGNYAARRGAWGYRGCCW